MRGYDETHTPQSHPRVQGEGGLGRRQGREDTGRTGPAVRHPPQPDHQLEGPAARGGCEPVRLGSGPPGGDPDGRPEGSACEDRRADAGEGFFGRCAQQSRPAERKTMIDRGHQLPLTRRVALLKLSRGSLYYTARPETPADLAVMRRIDEMHLDYPFAGSRMLRDLLRGEAVVIGRDRVVSMMRRMRIETIYCRPNTSKPSAGHKIYRNCPGTPRWCPGTPSERRSVGQFALEKLAFRSLARPQAAFCGTTWAVTFPL